MINADVSIFYNNLELREKAPCNKMKKKSFRKKWKSIFLSKLSDFIVKIKIVIFHKRKEK